MPQENLMKVATVCGSGFMKTNHPLSTHLHPAKTMRTLRFANQPVPWRRIATGVIGCLLLICLHSVAQVKLDTRVQTQQYHKGFNIMPVYLTHSNLLEYYTDAWSGETLEKFRVKLPDLTGCTDTAYAFIYFSGFQRASCPNYAVVIIGNAQSYLIPKFFIDYNHNLDYSDDGPAISFPYNGDEISFNLCNAADSTACLHYRLTRYYLQNQYELRRNLNDFFSSNAGTKQYVGLDNSYRIQVMNQWGTDVSIGTDSFRITVEDHNNNGKYNDPGVDHIQLSPYGTEPVSNNVNEGSLIQPKKPGDIVLQHLNESYAVSNIASNGRTLTLRYNGKHVRAAEKLVHKRAPRFKYELLTYRKYNKLRKFRGQEVYIFFYNFKTVDTATFEQLRALYEASGSRLKIIALNYGNDPLFVKDFVKTRYYMWSNGLATKKIATRYCIDQLPMGFYLNRNLRVEKIGITPAEMLQLIQNAPRR